MSPTRQALEDFLAANPDDLAAHSAYADWLTENGDPRGEYIRLLLAIEDRKQPQEQLRAMKKSASELGKKHGAEWLGTLKEHVNPDWWPSLAKAKPIAGRASISMRRGWIHEVRIPIPYTQFWDSLITCPISRLIQVFTLNFTGIVYVADPTEWLQYANKLPGLRQLNVHGTLFGDNCVDFLLQTGLIYQLKGLNLMHCSITDDGAMALAQDSAVRKLDCLRIKDNLLSPIGIDALNATGIEVDAQRFGNQRHVTGDEV